MMENLNTAAAAGGGGASGEGESEIKSDEKGNFVLVLYK